jgi:hypothetical protein
MMNEKTNNNLVDNINNSQSNNEIKLRFAFTTGETFFIDCKNEEKLSDIINRFKEINNIKEPMNIAITNGDKIKDKEKKLNELGIENNQLILFISQIKNNEKEIIEKKKQFHLTEDEKIQLKKWLKEYKENKIINKEKDIDSFFKYTKQKEKISSIDVKEHPHKLVYCISILNWKCSLCDINYTKEKAKYYCCICDFNMCDKCHTKGEYIKKKIFPEGITPSNIDIKNPILKYNNHEHPLIYCRSSRSVIRYNTWICDICECKYKNDIWSFYCTQCDYDLCTKCAGF